MTNLAVGFIFGFLAYAVACVRELHRNRFQGNGRLEDGK